MKTTSLRLCLLLVIIGAALAAPSSVFAQGTGALKYNPAAEQWVTTQIAAGNVANLAVQFQNPDDRVIRGSFVVNLLQSKSNAVAERGVWIVNATIVDNVVLQYAEINFPITIENSTFESFFSICRSHFHKSVSFNGSTFKAAANFCAIEEDDSLFLSRTSFNEVVDASLMKIGVSLTLDSSHFYNAGPAVNFSGMKTGGSVFLAKAIFEGQPNFSNSEVGGFFWADDVVFQNSSATANFENLHVAGTIFLNHAVFSGPVRFFNAYSGAFFMATGAQFKNAEGDASFENMHVERSIYLGQTVFAGFANFGNVYSGASFMSDHAQFNGTKGATYSRLNVVQVLYLNESVFAGPVDFTYMRIGSFITGPGVRFDDPEGRVNFGETQVGDHIFLKKAQFAGPVDFRYVHIGKNLELDDARFTNPEALVYFGDMVIESRFLLPRASFAGPVDFSTLEVDRFLYADGAQFLSKTASVGFGSLHVGESAGFVGAVFMGPVNFNYSEIGADLNLNQAQFKNPEVRIEFTEMNVGRSILMDGAVFAGEASFNNTDVGRSLNLSNSRFTKSSQPTVTFVAATMEDFYATNADWPMESGAVDLSRMDYEYAFFSDSKNNELGMISLLEQSAFDAEAYRRLSHYYRAQGYPEAADYVYIKSKQRERRQGLSRDYWAWWWNLFLEFYVLYGKSPFRAFLWCLLFVVIGYFVFRKRDRMNAVVETERSYRPFLYSLDLFLPLVDLGYARFWEPRRERRFARLYARIHQSLAWILIPIALLAIAGLFD